MASVFLIDDLPPERQRIADHLRKAGHTVVSVDGNSVDALFEESKLWLDDHGDVLDVLVLDIAYDHHVLGGIALYHRFEQGNYDARWRHLIIFTQLVHQALEKDFNRLETFMTNRRIPMDNLISKHPTMLDNLLTRINQLIPT